jgi:hypothetical protein
MASRDARRGRKRRGKRVPDRFQCTGTKRKRKMKAALDDGVGWACRFFVAIEELREFVIEMRDIGLEEFSKEQNLYNPVVMERIKHAIGKAFDGPFWAKIEVKRLTRKLHAHVLANAQTPRLVKRKLKGCKRTLERLYYLVKVPARLPKTPKERARTLRLLQDAKRRMGKRKLPRVSFSKGIKRYR